MSYPMTDNLGSILGYLEWRIQYLKSMGQPYLAAQDAILKQRIELCMGEMDTAARLINIYLDHIPLSPHGHNWLIRNGYTDKSYQGHIYGQELTELTEVMNDTQNG